MEHTQTARVRIERDGEPVRFVDVPCKYDGVDCVVNTADIDIRVNDWGIVTPPDLTIPSAPRRPLE